MPPRSCRNCHSCQRRVFVRTQSEQINLPARAQPPQVAVPGRADHDAACTAKRRPAATGRLSATLPSDVVDLVISPDGKTSNCLLQ